MEAREITMAALKKTAETNSSAVGHVDGSSRRLEIATGDSAPVDSAVQQLRLHLESALAASAPGAAFAEPTIAKWPRPVRAAILAGAVVIPWSLVVLTVHAIVG
jgi:hypothetical protein